MARATICLALALTLSVSAAAWAGPKEDADKAQGSGDYAKSAQLYRLAAEQGDVSAMRNLALQYQYGRGVAQNLDEAAKWNRRALEVLRPLAERGDTAAQYELSNLYVGVVPGVERDDAQMLKWVVAAAEHDFIPAQARLGNIYLQAQALPKDEVKALMWLLIATAPRTRPLSDQDRRYVDIARGNADPLLHFLKPAQVEQARKLAAAWKAKP
jgi:hypothetical protein